MSASGYSLRLPHAPVAGRPTALDSREWEARREASLPRLASGGLRSRLATEVDDAMQRLGPGEGKRAFRTVDSRQIRQTGGSAAETSVAVDGQSGGPGPVGGPVMGIRV